MGLKPRPLRRPRAPIAKATHRCRGCGCLRRPYGADGWTAWHKVGCPAVADPDRFVPI